MDPPAAEAEPGASFSSGVGEPARLLGTLRGVESCARCAGVHLRRKPSRPISASTCSTPADAHAPRVAARLPGETDDAQDSRRGRRERSWSSACRRFSRPARSTTCARAACSRRSRRRRAASVTARLCPDGAAAIRGHVHRGVRSDIALYPSPLETISSPGTPQRIAHRSGSQSSENQAPPGEVRYIGDRAPCRLREGRCPRSSGGPKAASSVCRCSLISR
jgi:hypothetical protein